MRWDGPLALGTLGLIVGFLGSLVGVGGGFFMVPYFVRVLGWTHPVAVGTSLGIVVANAASGTLGYARQKRVDWLLGLVLGLSTIPGTYFGKEVAKAITGSSFGIAFGAVTAFAAFMLVSFRAENRPGLAFFRRGAKRSLTDATGQSFDYSINLWTAALMSVVIGFISSLLGVGGGFVHVPLLILLYGVPPHAAVATSAFALMITSAAGAGQFAWESLVVPPALLWGGIGAFLGAQAGTALAPKMSGYGLRLVLAGVLLFVGAAMMWNVMFPVVR